MFARMKDADWAERQVERADVYKNKDWVEAGIRLFFPRAIRNVTRRAYRAGLRRQAEALSREQKARWAQRVERFRADQRIAKPPTFPEFLGRRILEHDREAVALLRKIDPQRAAFLERKAATRASKRFRDRFERIRTAIYSRFDEAHGERVDKLLNIFLPDTAVGQLMPDLGDKSERNVRWLSAWVLDKLEKKREREAAERRAREEAAEEAAKRAVELLDRTLQRLARLRGGRARGGPVSDAPPAVRDRLERIVAVVVKRFHELYWEPLVKYAREWPHVPAHQLVYGLKIVQRDEGERRRRWLIQWIASQTYAINKELRNRQIEEDRRAREARNQPFSIFGQPIKTHQRPNGEPKTPAKSVGPIAAGLTGGSKSAEPSKSGPSAETSSIDNVPILVSAPPAPTTTEAHFKDVSNGHIAAQPRLAREQQHRNSAFAPEAASLPLAGKVIEHQNLAPGADAPEPRRDEIVSAPAWATSRAEVQSPAASRPISESEVTSPGRTPLNAPNASVPPGDANGAKAKQHKNPNADIGLALSQIKQLFKQSKPVGRVLARFFLDLAKRHPNVPLEDDVRAAMEVAKMTADEPARELLFILGALARANRVSDVPRLQRIDNAMRQVRLPGVRAQLIKRGGVRLATFIQDETTGGGGRGPPVPEQGRGRG